MYDRDSITCNANGPGPIRYKDAPVIDFLREAVVWLYAAIVSVYSLGLWNDKEGDYDYDDDDEDSLQEETEVIIYGWDDDEIDALKGKDTSTEIPDDPRDTDFW